MRFSPHQIQIIVLSVYLIFGLVIGYILLRFIDYVLEKGDKISFIEENDVYELEHIIGNFAESCSRFAGEKSVIPVFLILIAILWLPLFFICIFSPKEDRNE